MTGRKHRSHNARLYLLISQRDREKVQNSQHKTVFAHLPARQGESTELATQDCVCSSPTATGRKYRTLNTRLCLLISQRDREKAQNSQHKTVFAHLPARQGESTELSTQDCVSSFPSATGRKHRPHNTRCVCSSPTATGRKHRPHNTRCVCSSPSVTGRKHRPHNTRCVCSSPSVTGRKYRTLNTRLC